MEEEDKKIGTETLDRFGEWFGDTWYGKRFNEAQQRNRELDQQLIDQGGPAAWALKIRNTPNPIEQKVLKGVSDVTNVDERITTPLTYLAVSGGLKSLSKLKPKHLGITTTYEKLPPRLNPKLGQRKLVKIDDIIDEVKSVPRNEAGFYITTTPVKGALASETLGGLYKQYPFLLKNRPAEGYSFAYDTSDAEVAYPGKGKPRRELRERIMSDSPDAIAYRELVDKHQAILADVKPSIINDREVKVSPLSEEELITDAQKLITLKENLGIPSPKVYEQELGAFIKDGLVARITGGQASSNKPAAFQSTKGTADRAEREGRFPVEDDPHPGLFGDKQNPRRVQSRVANAPEADHMNILETTNVFSQVKDSAGKLVARSKDQMLDLTRMLKKEDNIDLGNVNENWMMASVEAHRTGELAKHRTLGSTTDFQKPLTYEEADQVRLELKDGRTLLARQDGGKYYEGDVKIKPSQIKSKGNMIVNGREYTPSQMHGASLQLQDTLASITDTRKLKDAIKLFLIDSGAQEAMTGATVLSSYVYDLEKDLDPLTLKLREENIPSMIKYIDTLLGLKQYKNHKILMDLKDRFTNRLKMNRQDYLRDLRYERPLTPLPKSDGRRHVGGDPFKPTNNGATY